MTTFAILKTDAHLRTAVSAFLKKILTEKQAEGVLAAGPTPYSPLPMPMLFTDPDKIETAVPLAPAAPFNTARQAASLLRYETGKRLALVLRPCEIRALIELAKLKQCSLDNALIIGIECLGRMENQAFLESVSSDPDLSETFYQNASLQDRICQACKVCTKFEPKNADISLCVIGMDEASQLGLSADTDAGAQVLKQLGLEPCKEPELRQERIHDLLEKRSGQKKALMAEVRERTDSIEKFQEYFATCLNCYNCRVACPVCYCKECVFLTDVFSHDPEVLFRRAARKGMIKLPADTTMFHMTRMAHMAHACVGCGHCTSVCPSHIPVADIFIRVSEEVQTLYDYDPGRDIKDPIPLLVFDEKNTRLTPKADISRS